MAYDKQTFIVGQVLTATEQNQIEENIEEVRRSHKGTTAPPQLVAGVEWIDDTATPWTLKVYDGAGQINKGTIDPDLNLYKPATLPTFVNESSGQPCITTSIFNVTASVTRETWESVGPTGSGADNVWVALDNVSADVDWLELRSNMNVANGTGTFVNMRLHVREAGSTVSSGDPNLVAELGISTPTTGAHSDNATVQFKTPVNSAISFETFWTSSGDTNNIQLYLDGFGYNA